MAKTAADLMQDASEIVHYERAGIPLYVHTGRLCAYPDKRALCHWHEDIEFIRILEGRMNYRINSQKIQLHKNDCIMVNARQMHYGYSYNQQDCTFTCILFHPQLFSRNQLLYQEYVLPFLENRGIEFLTFSPENPLHTEVTESLDRIADLKQLAPPGYELEVIGIMHILWSHMLRHPQAIAGKTDVPPDSDLTVQRDMVSFIYQNYPDKVTLDDIASAGNVSRSKCCAIFKIYLQQSPIDFLNHYRLEVSRNLLRTSELNITQIATACGFNHLSYYSKLFSRSYGCTPHEYRNKEKLPNSLL